MHSVHHYFSAFFLVEIPQLNYNYVIEGAELLLGLLNPAAPHICGDN